ncbi:glycosyltransferase family 87 protein [Acidocella sp.]|uniref:glycosyltransferase family 87 protein n=1 Tax=Acidocella sp. TaxID=50710 RepID=UPI002F40EFDF
MVAVLLVIAATRPALNSDFMAFWSYPRFAAAHPVRDIYNAAQLQVFQQSLYPGFHSFYPYLYPPTLLLVTWWLRFCGFATAQLLWSLAGLAFFLAAGLAFCRRRLVLLALLVSPASLLNLVTGETAYFTSGLLLLGLAARPGRPILAGIAFGLLTLKPQLGVLLPIFLIAQRDWTVIGAAVATAVGLIVASCLAFPPSLWGLWFHTLPAYQASYFSGTGLNLNIVITPAANLITLGLAPGIAWAVQALYGLTIAVLVWLAARHASNQHAVAVLLAGMFLAVPHAYAYDSIPLIAAMGLCLGATSKLWQILLGGLVYAAPLLLLTPAHHWFLYAIPETLLFALIIALAFGRSGGALLSDEPNAVSLRS